MCGVVKGVVLDESVLFAPEDGGQNLQPGIERLLQKLLHSKISTGFSYGQELSADKVTVLKKTAAVYLFDCFMLNASSTHEEVMQAWGHLGGTVLHLVSDKKKDAYLKLSNRGWLTIVLNVEDASACKNSGLLYINSLEELPLTICHLNRKAVDENVVTVGYIMKPSRVEDFAKRGAFPLCPTQNGLMFMPITFELPLSSQLKEVDIILHKATDEIVSIEISNSSSNMITYTEGMQELERYMEGHPVFCTIDPVNKIYPVVDRLEIQQILLGLDDLGKEGHCKIRGAHFLQVNNFKEHLVERLSEAKLSLPCIVKPQVACGVAHAHSMAIVFKVEDFKDLTVPLPAIIQEYVDHSSTLFKFYVLGEKVFHAVKKSTPNAEILMKLSESNGLKPLTFDSLKSLPIAKDKQHSGDAICLKENKQNLDLALVTDAANWLSRKLDLTVFGFDVVIEESSGDHVIVDVNYLPSFKEVPDDIAIPAFWDAIKRKFDSKRA